MSHEIFICQECGTGWNDFATGHALVEYETTDKYLSIPGSLGAGDSSWDMARIRRWIEEIPAGLLKPNAQILDIGAGAGSMLDELRKSYSKVNLSAYEPSLPAQQHLMQRFGKNICLLYGENDFRKSAGRFDLVVLNHVLEHVLEPSSLLQQIIDVLVPGGMAYIEVPDASRYEEFRQTAYHFFDREHINHFSPSGLVGLVSTIESACRNYALHLESLKSLTIPVAAKIEYPAIGIWLKKTKRSGLLEYADSSERETKSELPATFSPDESFIVFGWGSFAQSFLARHGLLETQGLRAVIDSAESKWGAEVGSSGLRVSPPHSLADRYLEAPILVLSALYEDQILQTLDRLSVERSRVIVPRRKLSHLGAGK